MLQLIRATLFKRSYKSLPQTILPTIDEAIRTLVKCPFDLPLSYRDQKLKNKAFQREWGGKVRGIYPGTNKYRLAYSIDRIKKKDRSNSDDIIITLIYVNTRQNYYKELEHRA